MPPPAAGGEAAPEAAAFDAAALTAAIDECACAAHPALTRQLANVARRVAAGQPFDRSLARLHEAIEQSRERVEERRAALPRPALDADLPVVAAREEIAAAIEGNQVIVLCGDTGSGKTTQLPQICLALGRGARGLIGHTQPRRVAARSVSQRIGEELGRPSAVGYKIRFTDTLGPDACVKLMTDGIALAELGRDPELRQYDTLIVDEAHERSLNIDFLLGYLHRLLPRRPDLKLIITSATIDPERFARHFDGAPVVRVGGRTWPVDIRYRDPDPDDEAGDLAEEIGAAIAGLWREGPGDALVFLPTERDIRECATALGKRFDDVDILPLFGRQGAAEQQRIFAPGKRRRIVLATNVAETSLTVPGITYVVDTGTARISRYSVHSKVQRLPIEKISQASATQRAGRCGRLGPGICVRLYEQADFEARAEFTEPEILRTNLASVILQMRATGLGEIEDFPFIDPPEQRYVNDGYRLLQELGALDEEQRITGLGRRLARLPLDPRLGRVLLESERFGCTREALIVVAALATQDPRERPLEHAQAADEAHAAFADARSDFVALLNLWNTVTEQRRKLSGNRLRRWCRENFLAFMRLREWQDVHAQLRELAAELGVRASKAPGERTPEAEYAALHKAILSGFPTLVAHRDENRYYGARNRRMLIFPGSGLARRKPKWIVAAEITETARVYARTVAQVEPAWIEQIAAHLLKRSYGDPHWDAKRERVIATEQVSLYGLVLHAGRRANYAKVDPVAARELFIAHALVRGELAKRPPFLERNLAIAAEVHELEEKSRRRDILVEESERAGFYAERVPADVNDAPSLKRWLKTLDAKALDDLVWSREQLLRGSEEDIAEQFPSHWPIAGNRLPLVYEFTPGSPRDGVTLRVPVALLQALDPDACEWLVPGLRLEKLTALIKGLPKALRKNYVPAPDFAAACLEALAPKGELLGALSDQLERMTGVALPVSALREVRLEPHLEMRFEVLGTDGELLDSGRDLRALQDRWAEEAEQSITVDDLERRDLRRWDFGTLPEHLDLERNGMTVRVFPALSAEPDGVALRCFASPEAAAEALHAGLRELVKRVLHAEIRNLRRNVPRLDDLCLLYVRVGPCEELREDLLDAAIEVAVLEGAPTPRDEPAFDALVEQGRARLAGALNDLAAETLAVLELHHELSNRLTGELPLSCVETARDIADQLAHLVFPGFVCDTPRERFRALPRYINAALRRLEGAAHNPERDRLRRAEVEPLWEQVKRLREKHHGREDVERLRWRTEELRVATYAQQLGTDEKVSVARLEKEIGNADR